MNVAVAEIEVLKLVDPYVRLEVRVPTLGGEQSFTVVLREGDRVTVCGKELGPIRALIYKTKRKIRKWSA